MVDWDELTKEQRQAAGTLDRNVSLQAGAGTGKTTALTARFVEILRRGIEADHDGDRPEGSEDTTTPENILVTTFTERAAGELQESIRDELHEELEAAEPDRYDDWREAADGLDTGYIHTLHGFCSRLLREHALECRHIDPGFETLDEDETTALIRRTASRVIQERSAQDDVQALGRRYARGELTDIVVGLLEERPESLAWARRWQDSTEAEYLEYVQAQLHPISPEFAQATFEGETGEAIARFCELAADPPDIDQGDNLWGQIEAIAARVEEADIAIDGSDGSGTDWERQLCVNDLCDILTKSNGGRYSDSYYEGTSGNWTGHDAIREEVSELMAALYEWLDPTRRHVSQSIETDASSHRYVEALATLVDAVAERYEAEKRQRNLVDYTDQIDLARQFLVEEASEATLAELREQFDHVTVDEFQDTDPRQWDIIRALTDSETGPFAADNVFVVGDTKQSIYRFRNADVTMFDEVAGELAEANRRSADAPGETSIGDDQLSRNFRTLPAVLDAINDLFEHTFSVGEDAEFEAEPQALTAHRDDPEGIDPGVEYLCVPTDEDLLAQLYPDPPLDPSQATSTTELEAEALAARLTDVLDEGWQIYETETDEEPDGQAVLGRSTDSETDEGPTARDIEPDDIAILLRSRTYLKTYERALDEADIPYTVASGLGFYESTEVQALINLLRVLVDPDDDRALYAVLRSPMFGLTDDTIALLGIEADDEESLWTALHRVDEPELEAVRTHIQEWRRMAGLSGAERTIEAWSDLITEIVESTGYLVNVGADERPQQAVANVEKFRDRIRGWNDEGVTSLPELLDGIEERLESSGREGEATIAEEADGVRIMTIHDAKGDEFPMVVVPGIDRGFMDRGAIAGGKAEFEELPSGPAVGIKGPDPEDPMRDATTVAREGIRRRRRREERAEEKRTLYVACTRARDHLLLSGTHDVDNDADPAAEGLDALEAPDPVEASSWRDWVQDALLTDEVLADLELEHVAKGTIDEGSYTVRLPDRGSTWQPSISGGEATVEIASLETDTSLPPYQFSPSSLDAILSGAGRIVHDERSNRLVFRDTDDEEEAGTAGPGPKGIPANTFGDVIHKLAELTPPEDRWHGIAAEYIAADDAADIEMLDEEQLRRHGRAAVSFVQELEADAAIDQLHREEFVTAELEGGEIGGFIDLLAVADDHYHIIDFKTSEVDAGDLESKARGFREQLEAYAAALHQGDPARDVHATLLFTGVDETVMYRFEADELPGIVDSLSGRVHDRISRRS